MNRMNSPIQEIKSFVAENRTGDALSRMLELSQNNKQVHDAIHIVLAEFNDLTSQRLKGTIDNSEATRRLNVIHDKILIALGAFDSGGRVLPGSTAPAKDSPTKILGRLTMLSLVLSIAMLPIIYFQHKWVGEANWGNDKWQWEYAFAPLFLGFWTFIAYLLALVVSAFKK